MADQPRSLQLVMHAVHWQRAARRRPFRLACSLYARGPGRLGAGPVQAGGGVMSALTRSPQNSAPPGGLSGDGSPASSGGVRGALVTDVAMPKGLSAPDQR